MMNLPFTDGVLPVQCHECGIIALNKPAGIRSHPNKSGIDNGALLQAHYLFDEEAYQLADGSRACLLNRLDAPTSGLILLATDVGLAEKIRYAFAGREVEKTYFAVVKGRPSRPRELWKDLLRVKKQGNQLRTEVGRGGEPAVCEMERKDVSRSTPACTLLELRPHTGRTHQLRVQAASRHLPILGDASYGDFAFNRDLARRLGTKRLFLHSTAVRFAIEWQGQTIRFTAQCPMPEIFTQAVK